MKPFHFNLLNSLVLISFGLWGYFASVSQSGTALIPVFSGIFLLVLTVGIKNEKKSIAHIAVVLTLVIFIALFKPLFGAVSRNDNMAIFRVSAMMLTSLIALASYIKSFVDARRQ